MQLTSDVCILQERNLIIIKVTCSFFFKSQCCNFDKVTKNVDQINKVYIIN